MSLGLKDYWKDNKRNSLRFKLKNLKWELIYAWQRAWRGYDDMDVIEIQWTFVERCKKTLKDLHNATCRPSSKEFFSHKIHIWGHMLEENTIAGT